MKHDLITGRPCVGILAALVAAASSVAAQQVSNPSHQAPDTVPAMATFEAGVTSSRVQSADAAKELLNSVELPVTPIHTAEPDGGYDYGIWGAGSRYKMSFHDGATFVPYLGKDYPHNQPFAWRTASAKVGETELIAHDPQLQYVEDRAEYDLGQIVEAYDLRSGDVEQTFILEHSMGAGDLVIRGSVNTMLASANVSAAHQGLQFRDEQGLSLITYGAATAVDAAGRRQRMTTAYQDGQVVLRLGGEWLADASYPVVVDPIIAPGGQVVGTPRDEVDVVRDPDSPLESVWVAYSVWTSLTDRDVHLRRFTSGGAVAGAAYYDVTALWSSQGPSCTYVASAHRAVMLFDRYLSNGNRGMRYHRHEFSDLGSNTSSQNIVASGHAWRGDIGGVVQTASGDRALAVWQQEPNTGTFSTSSDSKIFGAYIDVASGFYMSPFAISDVSLTDQERPSVNKLASGASNNTWLVAYQTINTFQIGMPDDSDVAIREVDMSSNVSAPHYVNTGSSFHKYRPIIEGRFTRYLVAFLASPMGVSTPLGDSGYQIRTARINWSAGSGVGSEPYGTEILVNSGDSRLELGSVGHDLDTRSHWAVMLRSNATDNVYLRTIGFSGKQVHEETVFSAGSATSVLGGVCYDPDTKRFLLAYGSNSVGAANIITVKMFVPGYILPWTTSGIACSPASISWNGSQVIGSELGRVQVQGAGVGSLHVLALAMAPASHLLVGVPPIQNGCWLLIPNTGPDFVGLFDLRVGDDVHWTLPLPEFLDPDLYYLQDFHTPGNGPFELVSTQLLTLPTGK